MKWIFLQRNIKKKEKSNKSKLWIIQLPKIWYYQDNMSSIEFNKLFHLVWNSNHRRHLFFCSRWNCFILRPLKRKIFRIILYMKNNFCKIYASFDAYFNVYPTSSSTGTSAGTSDTDLDFPSFSPKAQSGFFYISLSIRIIIFVKSS